MKPTKASLCGLAFILLLTSSCGGKDPEGGEDIPDIMKATATVRKDQTISSSVLGQSVRYSIWLPPTYDEASTYPVLYLLHGYEFDLSSLNNAQNGWLNGAALNATATNYVRDGGEKFIIVTPNGMNAFYRNNYMWNGISYETFFLKEFIPFIEEKYHGNGKRAIAGLSMGGYGTLYHSFLNPSMFTSAYACSPATSSGMYPDLTQLVASCDPSALPLITIETGTTDMLISIESVQSFCSAMEKAGVKYELVTRGGGHDWTFWSACLPKILKQTGNSFK